MPTATVPNTFSNTPANTNPIDATQVNANFAAVLAAINGGLGLDNLNATALASTVKTGVIQMTGAATADTGFLLCDGTAVSRTTYATLFARISTAHGVGDGSTTFNVPDLRGRAPLGVGTASPAVPGGTAHTLGQKGGEETHALSSGEVPSHTHSYNYGAPGGSGSSGLASGTADFAGGSALANTGGGGSHNTLSPYTGVNFQIKT